MQFIVEISADELGDSDLGDIAELIKETIEDNLCFDSVEVKATPLA